MNTHAASGFETSERQARLDDLARLGSALLTEIVPHYVEMILALTAAIEDDDLEPDEATILDQVRATSLTVGLPLVHAVRLISERGAELAADDPADDPRALLPLLRPLAESYLSLAGIGRIGDVPEAFAASPQTIEKLIDDRGVNQWLLLQRRKGRLGRHDVGPRWSELRHP